MINTTFLDAMYDYRAAIIARDIVAMNEALTRDTSSQLDTDFDSLDEYFICVCDRSQRYDIDFLQEMIDADFDTCLKNDLIADSYRFNEMIKERI